MLACVRVCVREIVILPPSLFLFLSSLYLSLSLPPSLSPQISRITEPGLGGVPPQLKPLVKSLLVIEPSVRPDALQVTKVTDHTHHTC